MALQWLYISRQRGLRGVAAGKALISLGPEAAPALPELGRLLTIGNPFGAATRARWILQGIGRPAVPVMAAAVANKQTPHRVSIIIALSLLGADARAALPTLTTLLEDREPGVATVSEGAIRVIKGEIPLSPPPWAPHSTTPSSHP